MLYLTLTVLIPVSHYLIGKRYVQLGGYMFNDDVMAICPSCASASVSIDKTHIRCLDCEFEEPLIILAADDRNSAVTEIQKQNMIVVLRRWQFAG